MKYALLLSSTLIIAACSADNSPQTLRADGMQTTGTIISMSPDGQSVTIDHAPIDAIGMGAMTMGFGIDAAVDMSGYSAGDAVAIAVKVEDGSIFITHICNTARDGDDCLASVDAH